MTRPADAPDPHLAEGVALFNQGRFFECHEVLERRWLTLEGPRKECYKGLIQLAVAYYHWSRNNRAGALRVARSGLRYLKSATPAICDRVDVRRVVREHEELFGWLEQHPQRFDPQLVRPIRYT
ncbi:MAG: DUF309 domain-containing protein [Candidatus Omnitrophica bacterium]|nr:DUF309 domain-containing protein [Candidatus Omnitrophota bacterium]